MSERDVGKRLEGVQLVYCFCSSCHERSVALSITSVSTLVICQKLPMLVTHLFTLQVRCNEMFATTVYSILQVKGAKWSNYKDMGRRGFSCGRNVRLVN